MSQPNLVFWDWNRPVLEHAIERLADNWKGGELNLGHLAIIVPTSETGRRLREALAIHVAGNDGAVIAPYVWHPSSALGWNVEEGLAASGLQETMAWSEALQDLPGDRLKALFPVRPEKVDATWIRGTAETLRGLKKALGAGGHTMASVAGSLVGEMDHDRWLDLAEMESRYSSVLERLGVEDAQNIKRQQACDPQIPENVKEVLVMAVPDPPSLLRQWLLKIAGQVPVTIFVHASTEFRESFDELGMPLHAAWRDATGMDLPVFNEQLHIQATPREQAATVVGLLDAMVSRGLPPAVGACDPALNAHLESALAGEDVVAFDPAGRTAAQHAFVQVLRAWQRLAQSNMWRDAAAFLRLDDVVRAIRSEADGPSRLLSLVDELHAEHLPPTLDDAIALAVNERLAPLRPHLEKLKALIASWREMDCNQALRLLLEWLYGERMFAANEDRDADYSKLFGHAMQLAAELDATREKLQSSSSPIELLALLLDELEAARLSDTRGEVDFVLHGWLELPWEAAPGLVIAGFNEEHVPGIVTGDPFLPDALRNKLGLASQASRRARDAFLIRAMTEQRRDHGSLQIVLGRVNDQGDTQRPSRLLFDCSDAVLVDRVKHLFPKDDSGDGSPEPPSSIGFKLKPQWVNEPLKSISPSAIGAYLRCPFRYYLSNVLRMSQVDAAQREASPMDFGNLIHETLRQYALDVTMKDCMDGSVIARWLDAEVLRQWREQFGAQPLLSVEMQLESARQRLKAAGETLAQIRAEGWRTLYAEQNVREWGLHINGVTFSGKLDRVDQHVTSKALRVWDYKTGSDRKPADAHLAKADEATPPWQRMQDAAGKAKCWADVQLPLYVWVLRQKHPGCDISAGYFNLPATVSDTGVKLWTDLDDETIAGAVAVAEEVVRRIKGSEFWPPTQDVAYDDFEMLLGDPLATVDPSLLQERGAR